jgi:Glycosyl hydrolases family 2/Glycosyl hydrolases family 2, TIM barrel domain
MANKKTNFNVTESKKELPGEEEFDNPLPRTVLRSNTYILLDGAWRFAFDPQDVGLAEQWQQGHPYEYTAHWPGTVEQHLAEARGLSQPHSWQDKVVVWYERDFPQPVLAAGLPPSLFQITFGACGYETMVWLNGGLLQTIEGEQVHYGEHSSFSYEIQPADLLAENRLTVRIRGTMDAEVPRGKQESHVYKRGGIWYQTNTGAVRSVWLESIERNRLRSRLGVISVVEDYLVRFNVTTRIHDAGQYVIRLEVFERNQADAAPLATSDFPLYLEVGQKKQRLVVEVPGSDLWSPETPNLYLLVARLIDAQGNEAEIQAHFGIRKIESRGRFIYLNNKKIYLDGILYQPGTSSYEEMQQHLYAIKELGCNLVRVHIAGIDPRIYNLADEIGLLLWVEVPSPHASTPLSRKNHRIELLRMLALIETNPSVVIWSLYNESWGALDLDSNPETRDYIIEMYHYMHIHHPQFLVVDNDGWQHISFEGRLKSDLLTAHLYTPDLATWQDLLDRLTNGEMVGVAAHPLVVGDPFFYRKQVPIVISEWGGFGFPDYGGPQDETARARRIRQFKEELRRRPIAGDIYTQATNVEEERNGLIDGLTGQLKVAAGLLFSRDVKLGKTRKNKTSKGRKKLKKAPPGPSAGDLV